MSKQKNDLEPSVRGFWQRDVRHVDYHHCCAGPVLPVRAQEYGIENLKDVDPKNLSDF